jgi:hypothetical protein
MYAQSQKIESPHNSRVFARNKMKIPKQDNKARMWKEPGSA